MFHPDLLKSSGVLYDKYSVFFELFIRIFTNDYFAFQLTSLKLKLELNSVKI